MRNYFVLIVTTTLLGICAASIRAQQAGSKIAYVPDSSTSSAVAGDDKRINKRLAEAAVVFLEVRLNSLKDLRVERSKSPCDNEDARTQGPVQPRRQEPQSPTQNSPAELAAPDSYEVRTAIRTLGVSGLNENEKELVLDYELVKYVKCKPTSILHRSEPISQKTAFDGFLQMGDVLEVRLRDELAPPKITIDVAGISNENEALESVRDELINRVFVRLASESDFRVRDARGTLPSGDADYIVTGVLTKDKKGVGFTIKNVKDNTKSQTPFVSGPVGQKNSDALNAFYDKAAETVINYIRVCPSTAPTAAEVEATTRRASELLCKDKPICEPKPAEAILLLARLRCADKLTPSSLALLGDAYLLGEDFLKAADAYDQSWKMVGSDKPEDRVPPIILAGDAWYRAQNYGNAAERYEKAIATSVALQLPPPPEAVYLQRARSYRFAVDRPHALTAALDGLTKYPTSDQLADELKLAVANTREPQLRDVYEKLQANKSLDAVVKVLPDIQQGLAEYLLDDVFRNLLKNRNLDKLDKSLKEVETLPLASLSELVQDAYKIARAVWRRDATNDFANALAVLGPISEKNLGFVSEFATHFLATTYYERARRGGAAADKGDYERAVILFKKVILEQDTLDEVLVYANLTAANHELGKDQDTRAFLEGRLGKSSNDARAAEALVSLCLNYLRDFECADKQIKQFETDPFAINFRLRALELHVLRGEYAEAEKMSFGFVPEFEVALFYRVWTMLALDREKDGQDAARDWQTTMEKVRGSGEKTEWVFEAAKRALDAEPKLSSARKDLLGRMIAAMVDKTQPLPK